MPRQPMRRALVLLPLITACGGDSPDPGTTDASGGRSGVLISVDTTSADALSVYGADAAITPNLSALANTGVTFERARTVTPITLPAHASMLTGLYPIRHTVRDNGYLPLPGSALTLAEVAQAAGHDTAAFIAAGVLTAPFGLVQGFEVYDEPEAGARAAGAIADRRGREVTQAAIAWLDGRSGDGPFFLWAHYFDPHAPYAPGPRFLQQAGGDKYLGEVAAMDAAIGALIDRLNREPAASKMTIVVVGDHGESFGVNGEQTHGLLLHDATLHVPLIVRLPDGARAGERDDTLVSVIDAYPTLLAGMGLEVPNGIDGVDLASPPKRSGVYFENYHGFLNYGWAPIAGWASEDGLYVHGPAPRVSQPSDGGVLRALEGEPAWVTAALERLSRFDGGGTLPRADDEVRVAPDLTAFGYAGGAAAEEDMPLPMTPLDLPDPVENVGEHDRIWNALAVADMGRRSKAIEQLRAITAANPRNSFAHEQLGELLLKDGDTEQAIEVLTAMTEAGLERPSIRRLLSLAYYQVGDLPAAAQELDRYDELCPGDEKTLEFRKLLEAEIAKQSGQ